MIDDSGVPDTTADEDDIDGCDVEFHEAEVTPDEELPVAVGGVEWAADGDDADGCDVDFDDMDATPDEELPAAEGGIS